MSQSREERRRSRRAEVGIEAVCSRVTANPTGEAYPGRISNCSREGLCIEMARPFAAGTMLVVRIESYASADCADIPCVGISEVRWSEQHSSTSDPQYRIGLRYVVL